MRSVRLCHAWSVRRARTACFVSLLVALGCDVYHPEALQRYDGGGGFDASVGDAGLDAGDEDAGGVDSGAPDAGREDAGAPDAGPSCVSRVPPPAVPGTGADGPRRVYALRNVLFTQGGSVWNDVGYDLDETCSLTASAVTCSARGGGSPSIDGFDGVDNSAGREILSGLVLADPSLQSDARADQDLGQNAIILVIDGWDGSDDDAQVTAWFSQSLYGVPMGGARGEPLAWDGTDTFVPSELDFVDGDLAQPLIVDDAAHIAGRQLVMTLPSGRPAILPFTDNQMTLRLTDAVLVAELSADGASVDAARLTGRWALLDMSAALTEVGICPGTMQRMGIDMLVESIADVRSDPTTDAMGRPCDAVSLAIAFDGESAVLGTPEAPAPSADLCP